MEEQQVEEEAEGKLSDLSFSEDEGRKAKISGDETETKAEKKKPKTKRSARDIRAETLGSGAHLLNFKVPPGQSSQKWINEWTKIEKYGFFVTSDGCIMPYKYFRTTFAAGDGLSGHIRSVHFFLKQDPDRLQRVNQFGWPEAEEVSHLCHNPDCCNPLHLCIEARWKNWKRHYCGLNGSCDCGMVPQCVRTYTNPEVYKQQHTIEADVSKVLSILAKLLASYPFVIKPKTFYNLEDAKSANRAKRKQKQDKQKKEKVKVVKKAKKQ